MKHLGLFIAALALLALGCFIGYHGAVAHSTTLAGLGVGTVFGSIALAFATDVKAAMDAVMPGVLQAIRAARNGGAS